MSETKHTPGPWSKGKCGGAVVTDIPLDRQGADDVKFYGGYVICESVLPNNIPIIAAAPDMLAALKVVRPLVYAMSKEPWALVTALNETLSLIDAAIAKAEGGAK